LADASYTYASYAPWGASLSLIQTLSPYQTTDWD